MAAGRCARTAHPRRPRMARAPRRPRRLRVARACAEADPWGWCARVRPSRRDPPHRSESAHAPRRPRPATPVRGIGPPGLVCACPPQPTPSAPPIRIGRRPRPAARARNRTPGAGARVSAPADTIRPTDPNRRTPRRQDGRCKPGRERRSRERRSRGRYARPARHARASPRAECPMGIPDRGCPLDCDGRAAVTPGSKFCRCERPSAERRFLRLGLFHAPVTRGHPDATGAPPSRDRRRRPTGAVPAS